jgi:hypothetical protein
VLVLWREGEMLLTMNRFHVVTAYDILRMKGVDVGKFDFLNGAKLIEVQTIPKEE